MIQTAHTRRKGSEREEGVKPFHEKRIHKYYEFSLLELFSGSVTSLEKQDSRSFWGFLLFNSANGCSCSVAVIQNFNQSGLLNWHAILMSQLLLLFEIWSRKFACLLEGIECAEGKMFSHLYESLYDLKKASIIAEISDLTTRESYIHGFKSLSSESSIYI